MTRKTVAVENVRYADGRFIAHEALYIDRREIPVTLIPGEAYVGIARNIMREYGTNNVTMDIELFDDTPIENIDLYGANVYLDSCQYSHTEDTMYINRGRIRVITLTRVG